MSKFCLKTKDGEVINVTSANCFVSACEKFALIKRITKTALLSIFTVELDKR